MEARQGNIYLHEYMISQINFMLTEQQRQRRDRGGQEHRVAARINASKGKAKAKVPTKMADAVHPMIAEWNRQRCLHGPKKWRRDGGR